MIRSVYTTRFLARYTLFMLKIESELSKDKHSATNMLALKWSTN